MTRTDPSPAVRFPRGRAAGARPVLFFPPSGAEPSVAQPLVAQAAGLDFGVVELSGRGQRHDEAPPTSLAAVVEELADAVVALGGAPPVLVGHSFGGLLAYAVAVELEARGKVVGRLVAVTSQSPPSWAHEQATAPPDESPEETLTRRTERILRRGGASAEVLAHPELGARARELVRTDAVLAHQGFGTTTLAAPVTSMVAREDQMLDPHAADGWAEVTSAEHVRVDVPGGHFFYRDQPARLVTRLRLEVADLDSPVDLYA